MNIYAERSLFLEQVTYDAAFELKVVPDAQQNSNRGAGRKFSVDEKENSAWMRRVREWRKQKEQLVSTPDKRDG